MRSNHKKEMVVYTSVVCDLIHIGHINLFKIAKSLGDKLIVGVITDEGVAKYKRKPIIPFQQRLEVISSIKYVDQVIGQDNRSGKNNMIKIGNVSILTRGDDIEINDEIEYIKSVKGKFVKIPYTNGISTSEIIEIIKNSNK